MERATREAFSSYSLLPFKVGEVSFQTFSYWPGCIFMILWFTLGAGNISRRKGGEGHSLLYVSGYWDGFWNLNCSICSLSKGPSGYPSVLAHDSFRLVIPRPLLESPVHFYPCRSLPLILYFCWFASWLLHFITWSYLYCILTKSFKLFVLMTKMLPVY